MARQLVGAMIALALASSCGKRLNPAFCADNPDDGDCRDAGLVVIDAPPAACARNEDCTADPAAGVCDTGLGACVQCIPGVEETACTGLTPNCGEDRLCKGCVVDTNCPLSNVCLPNGQCADEANVLYAAPAATGNCTKTAPCTLAMAVASVTAAKYIIKMTTTSGQAYSEPPLALSTAQPLQILGTGTTFQPSQGGDAIAVTAGNVEIVGVTIRDATGNNANGVSCAGGARLTLRKMSIVGSNAFGVSSNGCNLLVERCRISGNPSGGLNLSAGDMEIRNNIIDKNGTNALTEGNVRIRNATGRFVFNTVANNNSENGGGGRVSGVACTHSAAGTFLVARNIIAGNGGANASTNGDCTYAGNHISGTVAGVGFVSENDLHLTAMTPATNPIIRDDPDADADCKVNGKYIDDYDGQPRPVGFCDRGADEYRP